MKLVDWIRTITDDDRALRWFSGDECEARIRRAYTELLAGYKVDVRHLLKTTRPVTGEHHGVVSIRRINYYSICAHHFLPFFGQVDIHYLPGTKIIGLGKFPRLVQAFSQRFQLQEDLVMDIAEEIMRSGEARGVRVEASGRHLCMCGRGPGDDTVETTTSYELGEQTLIRAYIASNPRA